MTDAIVIRPARREDAAALPLLEQHAGALFRTLPDLAWIADDAVMTAESHGAAIAEETCWVAAPRESHRESYRESPIGFLTARIAVEDGGGPDAGRKVLHVWQMAVAPDRQGKGLGRRLLDCAARQAAARGIASLTLTTFRDVAWNAPFYARAGFGLLDPAALTPRLRTILAAEAAHGLPAPRRCAMRRVLPQMLPGALPRTGVGDGRALS
ncbi:GNAT family N-acetyltransferase [Nguyenibacter vanlangensis]|uniref:GNAT family N-acetyltransferase n=1 Tax=Nguyenibacter vanlangensis TaxID=1216886 RepID=A0ABZ3DBN4_9PROT